MKHERDWSASARAWLKDADWQLASADRSMKQGAWTVRENMMAAQDAVEKTRLGAELARRHAFWVTHTTEPRDHMARLIRVVRRMTRFAQHAWDMEKNQ